MLTKEHAIAGSEKGRIFPDRLTQRNHSHYLNYAQRMVEIYRNGIGKNRAELHRQVHSIFQNEPECPSRRIDAFCKLLDDFSIYTNDISGKASNLRKKIFRLSAQYHPLVKSKDRFFEHSESEIKEKIAKELGKKWAIIQQELFADVTEYHRLREFNGYDDPRELLSRYNIGQIQVALYRAKDMTIVAKSDFKTILRYAKLSLLMHTIQRTIDYNYVITFDGPASVLRNTQRYGVLLAKFFPALVACREWEMKARIITSKQGYYKQLNLSSSDHLKGYFPALEEFDSSIEEKFYSKWNSESNGDEGEYQTKRNGWSLNRESEILYKGQTVFFPDFVLKHDDGRKIYMEIIGFWTPQYLKHKMESLKVFQNYNLLIAIAESVQNRYGMEKAEDIPHLFKNAITFKSSLILKDVLDRLETY